MRYIHSHNAVMARPDYDATLKLTLALLKRLDAKTVANLTGLEPKVIGAGRTPARRRTTKRKR